MFTWMGAPVLLRLRSRLNHPKYRSIGVHMCPLYPRLSMLNVFSSKTECTENYLFYHIYTYTSTTTVIISAISHKYDIFLKIYKESLMPEITLQCIKFSSPILKGISRNVKEIYINAMPNERISYILIKQRRVTGFWICF